MNRDNPRGTIKHTEDKLWPQSDKLPDKIHFECHLISTITSDKSIVYLDLSAGNPILLCNSRHFTRLELSLEWHLTRHSPTNINGRQKPSTRDLTNHADGCAKNTSISVLVKGTHHRYVHIPGRK